MNINQNKPWLEEFITSLSISNLLKLHLALSEIKSSIQINRGHLRIPFSYPTETGLQIILDKIVFTDGGYTWLSSYYSDDGNYYLDFDDESKEKLLYLFEISEKRIARDGIQKVNLQLANKVEINDIIFDLNRCKLIHINGTEININPESQEIKLLLHLINRSETVVDWSELIEMLGIDEYKNGNREVQLIKKRAVKKLEQVGMTKDEINKMIRTVSKKGLVVHREY